MDCTAVIVNYKTDALLAECLRSLRASTDPAAVETVVVDNSGTLLPAGFAARFPEVRFIDAGANLGFARGCNLGIEAARGRHVLLLNPDARVHPGAVDKLVRYLDGHPGAGIVGPRLVNPDGSLQFSCRRFPGWLTLLFGRYSLLTRLLPRNAGTRWYLYADWDHATERDVDWVSGAGLMARREAVERIGSLDEKFFLFVEDMDLCRRMWDAGWRVAYLPEACFTHHIGVSRGPVARYVVVARHRAMLHYVAKHFCPSLPLLALVTLGLSLRAGMQMLLGAPGARQEAAAPMGEVAAAWSEGGEAG